MPKASRPPASSPPTTKTKPSNNSGPRASIRPRSRKRARARKKTKAAPLKGKAKPKAKAAKGHIGGRVKPKSLMIFTRQLATLIDSGLPLLRSLTVLEKQEPNPVLKATVSALAENVQGGSTFSESLAQHPRIFNKLYVNMVKAGELGGVLEIVLNRLAEYQEKAQKLKNKIVSAMVYPVIVMFIAVAILVFLMIFIVPKFKEMFANTEPGAAADFQDRFRNLGVLPRPPA